MKERALHLGDQQHFVFLFWKMNSLTGTMMFYCKKGKEVDAVQEKEERKNISGRARHQRRKRSMSKWEGESGRRKQVFQVCSRCQSSYSYWLTGLKTPTN